MELLKQIGKSVGHVLRIDTHTATKTRGRYARLCIQVDINKPFITLIVLGGREQPICYEGIYWLCYACDQIGHRKEACPYVVRANSSPERVDTTKQNACMEHDLVVPNSGEGDTLHKDTSSTVSDDLYSPWLVVTRRRNANKSPKKGFGVGSQMQDKQDRTSARSGVMEGSDPTRHEVDPTQGQHREGKRKLLPSVSTNGAQSISFTVWLDSLNRDKGPSLQRISKDKGQSSSGVAQRKNLGYLH